MSILNKFLTATALAVSVAFTGLGQSPQSVYSSLGVRGVTYTSDASKSNYLVKTGINGKLSASVIPAEALAGNTEPFSYVFVDSTATAPGNGSAATPFTSLTTALSLKGSNSVIVAAPGNYGAVTVSSGVRRCHIKCSAGYGTSTTGAVVITSLTFLSPTLSRQVMLSGVKATSVTALSNSEIWLEDSNIGMGGDGSLTTLYADPSSTVTGFTIITPTDKAQYIEYVTGTSVKSAIDYLMTTNMVAFAAGTVPTNAIIYYNGTAWSYVSPGTNGQVLSAVGLTGVPTWLTYTNNVMDGSEGGEILTWSVAENRYKPLVIPGDTYIYGLTNSSGTSGVVRVPIRYGTNNQDIAVWDGYNWVGLSIGSNGTYLAATAEGVRYVKFPVPLGSNDGDLLCWDAATGMFRVIENNEAYTNRFLRGGTNPVFTAMTDYSSYDPRLPAPEAMVGITNGSLLYWSPEISKFLIVTGNTTDTNVFLRAGAIPTFTALPSVAMQGGVRVEDFASATNWLWVTKADLDTLLALSNQMVVADGALYDRDTVISNVLWQAILQEVIDRAAADVALSNVLAGVDVVLDEKINAVSNVLDLAVQDEASYRVEGDTIVSNAFVVADLLLQEQILGISNSVLEDLALIDYYLSIAPTVEFVESQDALDRAYAWTLFQNCTGTNNATILRFLDRYYPSTRWLEYGSNVLWRQQVIPAITNYQWYAINSAEISVSEGPYYELQEPEATVYANPFTTNLVTGATNEFFAPATGFYPFSFPGEYTGLGFVSHTGKVTVAFKTEYHDGWSSLYSAPGTYATSTATPENFYTFRGLVTDVKSSTNITMTFSGFSGDSAWTPPNPDQVEYTVGEVGQVITVYRETTIVPVYTNRTSMLTYDNLWPATNATINVSDFVVNAAVSSRVLITAETDLVMSVTNAVDGQAIKWRIYAKDADRTVTWPSPMFRIPSSSTMTNVVTITNGTYSVFVTEYAAPTTNNLLQAYIWGY